MRPITEEKMAEITAFMEEKKIDLLFLADWENSRDVNLRFLSGHPMDGFLLLTPGGETILIPWDVELAKEHATVDTIITDPDSRTNFEQYVKEVLKSDSPVIGVNAMISYRWIIALKKALPALRIYDNPIEVNELFRKLRSTKTPKELALLEKAGKIGNKVLKDIEKFAKEVPNGTENDLSFLVMKKIREYGAEDNSFPSLVANVERSHLIHCHPFAGNNQFSKPGLALIDFGALYQGYASDITVPISFGKLTAEQEKIKQTCFAAYEAAIDAIDIGVPLWKISQAAVDVIEKAGFHMPHGLGHGLGLTVHDAPGVRQKPTSEEKLKDFVELKVEEGMVFTIEPGVYVKGAGGQRLENDVMIKNGKVVVYTKSKPLEVE
ncbi:MAG: M24 family metallopeptidase [Candidatus Heimdallarchaeota archaeon]